MKTIEELTFEEFAGLDRLEQARRVLLVFADIFLDGGRVALLEANLAFPKADLEKAIHTLDLAGIIDAVSHASFDGTRSWRARCVTAPGLEVARLIRNDVIWRRLKADLGAASEPFTALAAGYENNLVLETAGNAALHGTSI